MSLEEDPCRSPQIITIRLQEGNPPVINTAFGKSTLNQSQPSHLSQHWSVLHPPGVG
ncbi:hypothetical protein JYU34_013717 [Plutella xylostella]|uniref:Uncharacterized protein n=1 Tax=Plutella xylostella TaxID=51655 RepID=A0ABQ7QAH0_PLUXY|nr:hypothetical protein JYU34_013717 [Plutella xylostella]